MTQAPTRRTRAPHGKPEKTVRLGARVTPAQHRKFMRRGGSEWLRELDQGGAMTEHEQLVADCEERESRLSDWERSFVDSIGKQLRDGRSLTPKQVEALELVWERATAKG